MAPFWGHCGVHVHAACEASSARVPECTLVMMLTAPWSYSRPMHAASGQAQTENACMRSGASSQASRCRR